MGLNIRRAARAVILDPDDQVLLVRFEFPTATVWALPGGGLDAGESSEAGLRRELLEELGLRDFDIGPHIWSREHIVPMFTGHDGQRDHIHLVRTERFEPVPTIGWDALRDERVHEIRWWSLDELRGANGLRFAPQRLLDLLVDLISHGPPSEPVETGI